MESTYSTEVFVNPTFTDVQEHVCRYYMNAIIVDETVTTNAVFFNDVMTDLLGVTCDDMVNLHGHDDPKIPPPHMLSKIGVPMMFNLTIKPDRSIIVNKVAEISMPTPTTTNLTPQTPDPKSLTIKRQMAKKTADFDLTGQLVWPGARLLNEFVATNSELLQGYSTAIELGSGVGVTGILCSRFCRKVVLTDHNDEILKKNIELHKSSENPNSCAALSAEKLEWGNSDQLNYILQKHPDGFDLVLGADIYILFFQQNSVPLLFDTVKQLLCQQGKEKCRFILAYISRSKMMDVMVTKEAIQHGLQIHEVDGSRRVISNLEGVIYNITL
ncbi:hypothetical protein E3N88_29311 [Mikania micrantha]|uniref:Uncharacterized protein n=1 Tax=Mikania micrantha TaxID=192012 RepID=A0A5N6MJ29_9ASTR|nr:hypothetical protein E3N88_29311 [Mikania micrantha]